MNDVQIHALLLEAEGDAPFAEPDHTRMRNEVLAHFDQVRLAVDDSQPAVDDADGESRLSEFTEIDVPARRRRAPLAAAAATIALAIGGLIAWASVGDDDGSDRLVPADSAPTPAEPFGPIGTTSTYDVTRDGAPQGTLDLTVENNDVLDQSRQVTTLGAVFATPGGGRTDEFGTIRFETTADSWSIPVSLGVLGGTEWPDCGDAAVSVPRVGRESSVRTLECAGESVTATTTTDQLDGRLAAVISLQTVDDDHELRVIVGADGRLDQMVIDLSTTVDLVE